MGRYEKSFSRLKQPLDPFIIVCFLATLGILFLLMWILGQVLIFGMERLSWSFVMDDPRNGMKEGGVFPAIFGTVALIFIMIVFVLPLGVVTAIYLHEYAKNNWLHRMIRVAINNLAGMPSIVFGLFGLIFFVQFVGSGVDALFFNERLVYGQPAILWSALTLALLTLPVVVVSTEEALRSIPAEMRYQSFALGATKFQTLVRVILPQSLSGILTGGILAVSRGAGEVAPILFTGAAYYLPTLPTQLNHQFMELGYHIFIMATQVPNVEEALPVLYSTILVLIILTFLLNLVAIIMRFRLRSRLK